MVAATPDWLIELAPVAPRPELVAHPPIVAGDRIVVAGSRVDYRGLDRATGAEAWHRPGGAALAAPLALAPRDVVLVHDCDVAVAAPDGQGVLACFDRIDPIAVAARSAGRIAAPIGELGDCTAAGGAWMLAGTDAASLTLSRNACRFALALADGSAHRIADAPVPTPPSEDVVAQDGDAVWRQVIDGGKSFVARDRGPRLSGLTVLAAARDPSRDVGAVVVRADASLTRDYLAAYRGSTVVWTWPLPPPPDPAGRGGPIAVTATDRDIIVFFDAARVARFTAPWAPPTDR